MHYARAECKRIRGDYAGALSHVRTCLDSTAAGRHAVWPWAATCEIECIRLLGRVDEACAVGEARVREARAAGLRIMAQHVEQHWALAEADRGNFALAVEMTENNIRCREEFGMTGLNLGWAYDARATVALRMHDRAGFERALQQCAKYYAGGRDNPALAARYGQLLQESRTIWKDGERASLSSALTRASLGAAPLGTVVLSGVDADSRAQTALESLLSAAGCARGQLFLLREHGLVCAAGEGATMEQRMAAEQLVASATNDDSGETADESEVESDTDEPAATGFETVLLTCPSKNGLATIGALTLVGGADLSSDLHANIRAVCQALIEAGDVRPSTL